MNLILFGPPGAGKGTQASKLAGNFKLKQVSTGDLLRNEIKFNKELGIEIESIINQGHLAPDKIVNSLLEKVISDPQNFNRLIFDGYPRNLLQIASLKQLLNKFNQKISAVFSLKVNKGIITKRITGRIICTKCLKIFNEYYDPPNNSNHSCDEKLLKKRSDDNLETILNRFNTYANETNPVLDYYKKNTNFYEIDGNMKIGEIYNEIEAILKNIRD